MSKGVIVEVLELTNGLQRLPADGQAGHNRAYHLAGPDNPLGLPGFDVG